MSSFYFILGNTPLLSQAELREVYPNCSFSPVLSSVVAAPQECFAETSPSEILETVGGTIKIARELNTLDNSEIPQLVEKIADVLLDQSADDKITFGVAEHGKTTQPTLELSHLKHLLIDAGKKARFIESPQTGLSAAVLLHKANVVEVHVFYTETGVILAKTEAVQDIDEWTNRDRFKPYANRKKGMLPPKLARMMVNLALGSQTSQYQVLYDPFCGTGTVLMEAVLRGVSVIGSDLDKEAVDGTILNLEWLAKDRNTEFTSKVFLKDVTQVLPEHIKQKIDFIVTEPFLGKPTPQLKQVPNIFRGLEKLYLGAFKRWTQLLNDGAKLVVIFPLVEAQNQRYDLAGLIDRLKDWGYTLEVQPLLYHRPDAIVQRQIMVFRYTRSKQ